MERKVKIACIQHKYRGSVQKTIDHVENEIKMAAKKGAKIISLQELFCLNYFCQTIDNSNFSLAETIPSGFTDYFCKIAKKNNIVLILPFFEKQIDGLFYNSAAVINENGDILDVYRKAHIPLDPCFYEKYYFREGNTGYKIIETKYAKISVLICWDQWFPEAARTVSLMGAEIIFYPTAIGILNGEEKLKKRFKDAWITIQKSHAIANGVFIAAANRTGKEDKIEFWGNSFIADPFGEIISEDIKQQEKTIICNIDLNLIKETRETWPFLRDRRTDSYLMNQ